MYDSTTAANVSGTVVTGVGSETLVLNISSADFVSEDVGTAIAVNVTASLADGGNGGVASNYNLLNPGDVASADVQGTGTEQSQSVTINYQASGSDLLNYSIEYAESLVATILRRPVAIQAAFKEFDGTDVVNYLEGSITNVVAGEILVVDGYGTTPSSLQGQDYPVTSFFTLQDGSASANNYSLQTGGMTVDIYASTAASDAPVKNDVVSTSSGANSNDDSGSANSAANPETGAEGSIASGGDGTNALADATAGSLFGDDPMQLASDEASGNGARGAVPSSTTSNTASSARMPAPLGGLADVMVSGPMISGNSTTLVFTPSNYQRSDNNAVSRQGLPVYVVEANSPDIKPVGQYNVAQSPQRISVTAITDAVANGDVTISASSQMTTAELTKPMGSTSYVVTVFATDDGQLVIEVPVGSLAEHSREEVLIVGLHAAEVDFGKTAEDFKAVVIVERN